MVASVFLGDVGYMMYLKGDGLNQTIMIMCGCI